MSTVKGLSLHFNYFWFRQILKVLRQRTRQGSRIMEDWDKWVRAFSQQSDEGIHLLMRAGCPCRVAEERTASKLGRVKTGPIKIISLSKFTFLKSFSRRLVWLTNVVCWGVVVPFLFFSFSHLFFSFASQYCSFLPALSIYTSCGQG